MNPIPHGSPAVMPVVDYEPPVLTVPQCRPASPVGLRRRDPRRSPADRPAIAAPAPELRAAAAFADAALRRVLEVIDRRRPATQLTPLLAAGLLDRVRSVPPTATGRAGAAILRRIRLQAAGSGHPPTAAEVFGTYRRGRRIHAVACRIERLPAGAASGWRVVALHIG